MKTEFSLETLRGSLTKRKAALESELAGIHAALEVAASSLSELTRRRKLAESLKRRVRPREKAHSLVKATWREAMGTMKDDEISREAARLGAAWRAAENARG